MLILRIYLWANARKYVFKLPDFRRVVIHDSSKLVEPLEVRVSQSFSSKGKQKFTVQGISFEAIPDKNGGGDLGSYSPLHTLVRPVDWISLRIQPMDFLPGLPSGCKP